MSAWTAMPPRAALISCCTTVACAARRPMRPAGWDARWVGMRRLLLRQYLLTAVQFALLVLAVLWPQT